MADNSENNKGVLWVPGQDKKPGKVTGVNIDPHPLRVTRRLRNIYLAATDSEKTFGAQWYDRVHEATKSAISGTSIDMRTGAGIVAAVSPNMDWERDNISAFDELAKLTPEHWLHIHASANQPKVLNTEGNLVSAPRSQAVTEILHGKGISKATDANLVKAYRLMHGKEDVEDVLPRRTAPKTNSFARNIGDPGSSQDVTVDGRSSDMVADAMRPWTSSRGISSAALKNGNETRYEGYERHHQRVAASLGIRPLDLQAITWTVGKNIERGFDEDRVQGDARKGQSYQKRLDAFGDGLRS